MASLVEKAKEEFGEQDARQMKRRMADGSFGLDDFIEQFRKVQNMGSISQLLGMIPGMGNIRQQLSVDDLDDDFFARVEAIICSMTPEERRKPDILNGSRRRRIAQGSGTTIQDVNQLLNQFKEARKMMKAMASGRMDKMLVGARR